MRSRAASWREVPRIRRYLGGFGADSVGDLLWYLSLAWAAGRIGNGWGGVILFAGVAPTLVLAPLGGALVDRVGVTRAIRWTLVARAALMVAWAAVLFAGVQVGPGVLVAAALALGCIDGLHLPALETWPLTLGGSGPPGAQTSIFAAERTITRTAQVAAGVGAGELLARWGAAPSALVAGGLFLVALLLFVGLGPAPLDGDEAAGAGGDDGLWAGARRGIAVVAGDRVLRRTVAAHSGVNLLTGGVTLAGLPLWISQNGWSARWFGAAFASWGLGLLAGTVLLLRLLSRVQRTVLLGLSAGIVTGLALAVAVLSGRPWPAVAAVGVAGLACGPLGPCLGGYLREQIVDSPDRGAVTGFQALALSGLEPFGYLAVGGACALWGAQTGIVAAGLAVAGLCGWALLDDKARSAGGYS